MFEQLNLNNFKMKNSFYTFLLFSLLILTGCSSDNTTENYEFVFFNFSLDGYFTFSSPDYGAYISKYLNNDNTIKYTINSIVVRNGNNPVYSQDAILPSFTFNTTSEIAVNQIIPITAFTYTNEFIILPHNNNNFNGQTATNFCDQLNLKIVSTSTGTLKITQIDNDFVYGEFSFQNLKNSFTGSSCTNYPTSQFFSISSGTFKAGRTNF